ncbi:MAG TPA: type I pantothenate kinase [Acidimicrobiia bacterium]|nr:type I pantothenate kinase [Acidimicrobiia bacterium]
MTSATDVVRRLVQDWLPSVRPVVVGIAGGVASGKSRLADDVRDALPPVRAEVVSTDGFLFPNVVLSRRGLQARKGFPESYDAERLRTFLAAVRFGDLPQAVPTYAHEIYDVADTVRVVDAVDVLVIEGVNVLAIAADLLDVGVYLDAAEEHLERWYGERFVALCAAAQDDPTSFYRAFAGLTPEAVHALAAQVWRDVNHVNLRDHIGPSRDAATCVIELDPAHQVRRVTVRDDDATGPRPARS